MNRAVLYIAMSLDGFVAKPNGDISWLFEFNDVDYGYDRFFSGVGSIVQGKRAYEQELQHGWENAHPVPTFVLTHHPPARKPQRPDVWFTSDDISEVLEQARRVSMKDIWIEGGANIAQQFLSRGLIDDITLTVAPVLLGGGISLFGGQTDPMSLDLRDIKRFDRGLVQLLYAPH